MTFSTIIHKMRHSVKWQSVVMLGVIYADYFFCLVSHLSPLMLSVIMLNVIMLSVVSHFSSLIGSIQKFNFMPCLEVLLKVGLLHRI
jgi:hypothetical protein